MRNAAEAELPDFRAADLSTAWTIVWQTPDADELVGELQREMSVGHILHGETVEAVAIRRHRKEAIYLLPQRRWWAVVHLTWAVESDPKWPSAVELPSWSAVVDELTERGRS